MREITVNFIEQAIGRYITVGNVAHCFGDNCITFINDSGEQVIIPFNNVLTIKVGKEM